MDVSISGEICQRCAECCKHYPFVKLSRDEVLALGKLTGLPLEVFAHPIGGPGEGYFLLFQENGSCIFLTETAGEHSCSVYKARSALCREYPSTPPQHEVCARNQDMTLRKTPVAL